MKQFKISYSSRKILSNATKASETLNLSPKEIETHMIELFYLDFINDDVVAVYNRLESQWKRLTNYIINH